MNQITKKVLISTGVAASGVAIAGIVSCTITKHLVRIALDREAPKNLGKAKQKMTGGGRMDAELAAELASYAEKLEQNNCEPVEIISHDGERLVGHWYPCENAERIIIAMHGWRSYWAKDFGAIAEFWHKNGCSVLYAEQRGQHNSGGAYMGFGLIERYDCLDWIQWLNQIRNGEELPIYLAGISMGATTVLMAAGLELPENVCGIIADCGFTSPHAIWKHVVENNMHLSYRRLRMAVADAYCKQKIQMTANEYSTVKAMQQCTVPVLFIHGTDDHFVPVEMTYENYKACAAPKYLHIVPGAEHGMSYFVDRAGYEEAVKAFWNACEMVVGII